MTVAEWATIGSLTFNVIMVVLGLKIKTEVMEAQASIQKGTERSVAAMQDKLREVELYTRDNFVRSSLFDQIVKLLSDNTEMRFGRLQASMDRLEDKVDRLTQTRSPGD